MDCLFVRARALEVAYWKFHGKDRVLKPEEDPTQTRIASQFLLFIQLRTSLISMRQLGAGEPQDPLTREFNRIVAALDDYVGKLQKQPGAIIGQDVLQIAGLLKRPVIPDADGALPPRAPVNPASIARPAPDLIASWLTGLQTTLDLVSAPTAIHNNVHTADWDAFSQVNDEVQSLIKILSALETGDLSNSNRATRQPKENKTTHVVTKVMLDQKKQNLAELEQRLANARRSRVARGTPYLQNLAQQVEDLKSNIASSTKPSKLQPETRTTTERGICDVCFSDDEPVIMLTCKKHKYCGNCLENSFKTNLADPTTPFPPTCCNIALSTDLLPGIITNEMMSKIEDKLIEKSIERPMYCIRAGCFIRPSEVDNSKDKRQKMAWCWKCHGDTCATCRKLPHAGPCSDNVEEDALINLAKDQNWQFCGKCKAVVSRSEGCNKMRCLCGHQFCYRCGKTWKTCGEECPYWDAPQRLDHNIVIAPDGVPRVEPLRGGPAGVPRPGRVLQAMPLPRRMPGDAVPNEPPPEPGVAALNERLGRWTGRLFDNHAFGMPEFGQAAGDFAQEARDLRMELQAVEDRLPELQRRRELIEQQQMDQLRRLQEQHAQQLRRRGQLVEQVRQARQEDHARQAQALEQTRQEQARNHQTIEQARNEARLEQLQAVREFERRNAAMRPRARTFELRLDGAVTPAGPRGRENDQAVPQAVPHTLRPQFQRPFELAHLTAQHLRGLDDWHQVATAGVEKTRHDDLGDLDDIFRAPPQTPPNHFRRMRRRPEVAERVAARQMAHPEIVDLVTPPRHAGVGGQAGDLIDFMQDDGPTANRVTAKTAAQKVPAPRVLERDIAAARTRALQRAGRDPRAPILLDLLPDSEDDDNDDLIIVEPPPVKREARMRQHVILD